MVARRVLQIGFALLSLVIPAFAQTTYVSTTAVNCRTTTTTGYPIVSMSQFLCVSVTFTANDGSGATTSLQYGQGRLEEFTPAPLVPLFCEDPNTGANVFASYTQTAFTPYDSSTGTLGSYGFDWQGRDSGGGFDSVKQEWICGNQHSGHVDAEFYLTPQRGSPRGGASTWIVVTVPGAVDTVNPVTPAAPVADGNPHCPHEIPNCVPKPPLVSSLYRCGSNRRACLIADGTRQCPIQLPHCVPKLPNP